MEMPPMTIVRCAVLRRGVALAAVACLAAAAPSARGRAAPT